MIKNYYEILEISNKSTSDQIAESYRKHSLRNHPKTTRESPEVAANLFAKLSEAYEVLSDPIKKAFYDKYGYQRLKQGFFEDGKLIGGYRYADNGLQIFQNFFKQKDAVSTVLDLNIVTESSIFGQAFGGLQNKSVFFCEDLIVKVSCTLDELYNGCSKLVYYDRKVLNSDGRTTSMKNQSKLLHIKPGYGSSTMLDYKQQGHETVHRTVSNLYFQIVELPHNRFIRKGDDLIFTYELTLSQALECKSISVNTLDNRNLTISLDEIITPQTLQEVNGQGFLNEKTGKRGHLYIKFNILFPVVLSQDVRKQLRALLA